MENIQVSIRGFLLKLESLLEDLIKYKASFKGIESRPLAFNSRRVIGAVLATSCSSN